MLASHTAAHEFNLCYVYGAAEADRSDCGDCCWSHHRVKCQMWHPSRCELVAWVQVRQRELEEKKKVFESLQKGKPVVPGAGCLEEEEDEEAEPDLVVEVPKHKVKLIIGAGGENIKQVQRRTHTRIQVRSITLHLVSSKRCVGAYLPSALVRGVAW